MDDLLQILFLGFVIGLTGALTPGPTLVATINASLTGDWTTGLKISLGHMIVETVIFLLIVMGLATVALPYTSAITGIGGISLIIFGALTITSSRKATLQFSPARTVKNAYMAGLVTSAASPYFWIWWLSVGSAMVIAGMQGGLMCAGIFMIGHWCSDIGWFTLVSTTVSQGITILTDTSYRNIVTLCGIFLILFGVYYLSRILVL